MQDNLPINPAIFVGREREIAQIERALADPDINIVTIHGVGGSGKTVLARLVVERQRETNRFPGGIVWIDCRIEDSLLKILTAIVHTIAVQPASFTLSNLRKVVLSHLRSKPTLLVLDAYEIVANNDEILSFIGRLPKQAKALIVSRQRVRVPGREITLRLESLTEAETLELLRRNLSPERWAEIDKEALREIHRWTGGLPLAVGLVGSLLEQGGLLPGILGQLREGTIPAERVVERVLDRVDTTLTEKQHQLLDALSVFAHSVDGAAIAAVTEIGDWRLSAEALARRAVIEITDGRYALHPLVRTYFRNHIAPERLEVLQRRMVQYYLAYIEKSQYDFDQIEREWLNVQYASEIAYHNQLWQLFIAFVLRLGEFTTARGYENEYQKWLNQAIEVSDKIGDVSTRAALLHNLGVQYQQRGDLDGATKLYEQSLTLKEATGDSTAESATLTNLGSVYRSRGDIRSAIAYYERALAISRQMGDRLGEANILASLGVSYADLGEYHQARAFYEQAFSISREIGDRRGEANALSNLGAGYADLGEYHQATAYYEQALAISEQLGDRQGTANLLGSLGAIYARLAQYQEALRYYEQALTISEQLGDRQGQVILLTNLGNVYINLVTGDRANNVELAIGIYQRALEASNPAAYPIEHATILNNLADAYASLPSGNRSENLKKAIVNYEQALRIFTKEIYPYEWLRVTTHLSIAYAELGNWPEAKAQATTILESFQSTTLDLDSLKALLPWYQRLGELAIQNQDTEFSTRVFAEAAFRFELQGEKVPSAVRHRLVELKGQLGDDRFGIIWAEAQRVLTPVLAQTLHEARELMGQERYSEAADKLSNALTLISEADTTKELKRQKATVLFLRGFCLRKQELWEEALREQEQAFQLFEELRDYVGEAHTFLEMGHLFEVMNNYEDARLHYMDAYRLYGRAEDRQGMALASENLGRLEYRVRMFSQAVQDLEEARKLYISIGNRTKAATIESDLETAKASLAYQVASEKERGEG